MQAVHGSLERRSPDCFNIVVLMKVVINRTHPVVVFLQALSRAYIYNECGLRAGVLTEQTLMRARV